MFAPKTEFTVHATLIDPDRTRMLVYSFPPTFKWTCLRNGAGEYNIPSLSAATSSDVVVSIDDPGRCVTVERSNDCLYLFMLYLCILLCCGRYLFVVNVTRGTRKASATAWIPIQGLVSASYRVLSASANAVGSSKGRLNPSQQISIAGQVATSYPRLLTTLSYEWFGEICSSFFFYSSLFLSWT